MIEFSEPKGPWSTVVATDTSGTVALIRKVPHQGFQVTMKNGVRWRGNFGETNVAFLPSLNKAKNFVKDKGEH